MHVTDFIQHFQMYIAALSIALLVGYSTAQDAGCDFYANVSILKIWIILVKEYVLHIDWNCMWCLTK